jgi:hypothetical protein
MARVAGSGWRRRECGPADQRRGRSGGHAGERYDTALPRRSLLPRSTARSSGRRARTADTRRMTGHQPVEDDQWNRTVAAAEELMSYPFDPELAAAVAMMPVVEITDIPSARTQMAETCRSVTSSSPARTAPQMCGCGSTPRTR